MQWQCVRRESGTSCLTVKVSCDMCVTLSNIHNSGEECDGVEYCDDFAPVITTDQLSVGFVAGSNLTLNCEVRGSPPPSMSWSVHV